MNIETPFIYKHIMGEEIESFIFKLNDGNFVEAIYFPPITRDAESSDGFCFSVSVGCALAREDTACIMCATGKLLEYKRALSSNEMTNIAQQLIKAKQSSPNSMLRFNFSGEGEPLYNMTAVLDTVKNLQDEYGSERTYFFISTVGIAPAIPLLAHKLISNINPQNVYLQISLHGMTNEIRNRFIPINQKFSLEELGKACTDFVEILRQDHRIKSYTNPLYNNLLRLNFIPMKDEIGFNFNLQTLDQDIKYLAEIFPVHECHFQLAKWNYVKKIDSISPVLDDEIWDSISQTAIKYGFMVKRFLSRGHNDKTGGCGTLIAQTTTSENS